jgi:amino acid transporter
MGMIACGVALSAGEMSAFMPVTGGFVRHATRFVQPALGIATGWNFWYTMAITAPAELAAAATLINFWDASINPAIWYSVFIVIIVVINFCGVRVYGEVSVEAYSIWFRCSPVLERSLFRGSQSPSYRGSYCRRPGGRHWGVS